jgi:two-component system NtrC family sensor kinase
MIFATIIDLLLVMIFYFYGPKQEANKWAVLFLMCVCLGSFALVIVESIIPNLQLYNMNNDFMITILTYMYIAFNFIGQVCSSYSFLLYAIVYSEITTPRNKNLLAAILLLPIIVTFFITPMKPDMQINFSILLFWVVPYYLVACFLLIYTFIKESNPEKKKNRLITVCFFVPPIIVMVIFNNLDRAIHFGVNEFPSLLSIFVGIAFVIFLLSAFRYGALGVRIKFEKQLLNQTITGVASGTAMLNHTLKNRITNIDMLTDRLKKISQTLEHKQMDEDIKLIQLESQQMMQMVKRVQKQLEDIEIIVGKANLIDMLRAALQSNHLLLESKRISRVSDYLIDVDILCDKIHLEEVFHNLIRNAADSVERDDGKLFIRTYDNKSSIFIGFSDNGSGMSKEVINKIFDPFYSTKHNDHNFGLGLSYCYLVIQKHGGKIDVVSKQGAGTTFTIQLPKWNGKRKFNI